jgi:RimJ/RimL family protein N-acetyltransferase
MRFVVIDQDGKPEENISLPEIGEQVAAGNRDNYKKKGFQKPWCAYFAVVDGQAVGACAFKTPVRDGRVEIAYITFPEFEGRGIATQMARKLVEISSRADKTVLVTAQTLPERNASTSVLTKLGFKKVRDVNHPEDGLVWEWELNSD